MKFFTVHSQYFAAILCQLIEMDTACLASCHSLHFIFALHLFHTWGIKRSLQYFLMPLGLMHVRRVITIHVNFEICDFNSDPCVTSIFVISCAMHDYIGRCCIKVDQIDQIYWTHDHTLYMTGILLFLFHMVHVPCQLSILEFEFEFKIGTVLHKSLSCTKMFVHRLKFHLYWS